MDDDFLRAFYVQHVHDSEGLKSKIAECDEQVAVADKAIAARWEALQRAIEHHKLLTTHRDSLVRHHALVVDRVAQYRPRFGPLAGLDDATLSDIFVQAVSSCWLPPQPDQSSEMYEAEIVAIPFAVTGVCKRWRRVALHTVAIWTNLVTSNENRVDSVLRRWKPMLKHSYRPSGLSQPALLRVVIQLPWRGNWQKFVHLIAKEASRLQHLSIVCTGQEWVQPPTEFVQLLQVLRCPLPNLQRLEVLVDEELADEVVGQHDEYPLTIGSTPNLKAMLLRIPRPRILSVERHRMLQYIWIDSWDITYPELWQLIGSAPHLYQLELDFVTDNELTLPSEPISLIRLEVLKLWSNVAIQAFEESIENLHMPKVHVIELVDASNIGIRTLQAVATTLTSLSLENGITDIDSAVLLQLVALQQLRLYRQAGDKDLVELLSHQPMPCPRLSSIVIERSPNGPSLGDALVRLLQFRNFESSDSAEKRTREHLKSLVFPHDVPVWHALEIKSLLAAAEQSSAPSKRK